MRTSKLIKALTLSCFALLMASFVAYRSDVFNNYMAAENNESILKRKLLSGKITNPVDSPIVKKNDPAMMSTSKSMILIDDQFKPKQDSFPKKKTNNKKNNSSTKKVESDKIYMGGSKSGIMFKPEPAVDTPKTNPKK